MKISPTVFAVLILCSVAQVALAQAPIFIDFDDLSAPCDFSSAQPLRDEYAAFGVEFRGSNGLEGGAAALGECSGFGVPGYSPPNFASFDPEALLADGSVPDALVFSVTGALPHVVRVTVGGPPGTTVFLRCSICPWSWPGCDIGDQVVLGDGTHTLEVSAEYRVQMDCSVSSEVGVSGTWIVDDLELHYQLPAIPSLSSAGIAVFAAMITALGFVMIRRTTKH